MIICGCASSAKIVVTDDAPLLFLTSFTKHPQPESELNMSVMTYGDGRILRARYSADGRFALEKGQLSITDRDHLVSQVNRLIDHRSPLNPLDGPALRLCFRDHGGKLVERIMIVRPRTTEAKCLTWLELVKVNQSVTEYLSYDELQKLEGAFMEDIASQQR
jgi:hypothetical protein